MRVLHIEDDSFVQSIYRRTFEFLKVDLVQVGEYDAIVNVLDENNIGENAAAYDLVICDYNLPGIKGDAVVQRIRGFSDVPIIANGALSMDNDRMLLAGANDAFEKGHRCDFIEFIAEKISNLMKK